MQILSLVSIMLSLLSITSAFTMTSNRIIRKVGGLNMMSSAVSYKVGFMFPGQGAQAVGMAGALCDELPEAKALFNRNSSLMIDNDDDNCC